MQHILSDYKRVLKENEILKEEKSQAWEEWNNLEQGSYETGQKLKQQIKELQKENEELKSKNKTLEELLQGNLYELYKYYKELAGAYQGNCIPVQKVKDKIEELYKQDRNWSEEMSEPDSNFKNIDRNLKRIKNQIDVLLELLEGRE